MWFVVCLFQMVAMIMLGNANSELIVCTTPSGSKGLCLVKEICPSIMRMERINTAITRLYIQNSICGYDENFVLSYCCAVKNFTGPVLSEFDDLIEKAHPGFLNPINEVKHGQCVTPDNRSGFCGSLSECPYFNNFLRSTKADDKDFVLKSICGYDLDNSKLYCCDGNRITKDIPLNRPSGGSLPVEISSQNDIGKKKVELVRPILIPQNTTPSPLFSVDSVISPQPIMTCQTPNGDRAQCIPLDNCTSLILFLRNNSGTSNSEKRYIRESKCSSGGDDIFVCCGNEVDFRYPHDTQDTQDHHNSLIPHECGVETPYIAEPTKIPLLQSRNANQNMNFTIPNRIFGGDDSDINEFPWLALLQYEQFSNDQKSFQCAGTLISSRYVLTAAHCILRAPGFTKLVGVRLGEWNYNNEGGSCMMTKKGHRCSKAAVDVGVVSIHVHPGYNPASNGKYDDIGLIRLDKNVTFTSHISPICLPPPDSYLRPGERLTIAGWGLKGFNKMSSIKQKVDLPVASISQCSIMFENSDRLSKLGKGQFCAGGESGKDSCTGDSGAPLMRRSTTDPPRWSIEGIVSFGVGCGLKDHYGVYTKVSKYLSWIHSNITP